MINIELQKGDITKVKVDAIVNAANSSLMGGGGVDGAIHRAGGNTILEECIQIRNRKGGCKAGEAVITGAGNLPAKFVIHTVGPVWSGGQANEPEKLAGCYRNSLLLAVDNKLKTIAFPNVSTGIYGYPKKEAAQIAIHTIKNSIITEIDSVIFVCYDEENYRIYKELLNDI
ncbi:O-acetyl-ADP-ribose deacetylase [Labilibacter sediminis]|nr:O-acetyl-ADP-ribose deacetylase [Labilibacter sediminis]